MNLELGKEYTGIEFNSHNLECYRLTNETENHRGFQHTDGLNIDTNTFNPNGCCQKGGLYFFIKEKLLDFYKYTNNIMYIRKVTIPNDARVYIEEGKIKADKFILGLKQNFYLDNFYNYNNILILVEEYGRALKYVKNQTDEICLAAVKEDGRALKFVNNQTTEICLAAVNQDGISLNFANNQTEEICLAAVNQNGFALKYVNNQTEEICLAAVNQDGFALQFVEDQTEEICLAAVNQNKMAFKFLKKPNE